MIASDALSQQIIGVIVRVERLPPEHVTIDTAFSDLGLDSLARLNIVFALEEEFKVSVPNEAVAEIRTVRDAVRGIEMLLADQGASPAPL